MKKLNKDESRLLLLNLRQVKQEFKFIYAGLCTRHDGWMKNGRITTEGFCHNQNHGKEL